MRPVLRVVIPDSVLAARGQPGFSDAARAAIAEVGRAAADFPSASIVVSAGSRKTAEEIKSALARDASVPEARIAAAARDGDRGAELLLVVP